MFESARLKLTAWYLIIIMAVSVAFSAVIFVGSTSEFDRVLRLQKYRIEHPEFQLHIIPGNQVQIAPVQEPTFPDQEVIEDAEVRLFQRLLGVNIIILVFSALAGYFLAGRTLRPIQKMVDEQNRFVTDASHELNTPLTSLRTAIEVNLRDKHLTLSTAKSIMKSNLEEVESLQILSGSLIEFTQYEKGQGKIFLTSMQLPQIIQNAVNKVEKIALEKQIQMNIDIPNVSILGDEKSITELFVILLDNAIKYSPEKTTITVDAKRTDGKVEIYVIDEGIGIEKEDIPHIFDRFYRADKSRSKQQTPGYGLGLSIAKRIVDAHKGSISVSSTPGKGTTFTLLLPIIKK